ncbi:hypothetical protein [Brevibacterium epidermidis]|uniref:hypothetical protein n=1 Tax=Brevibacterium epidermidis TaxID=1698 RepID=UPI000784C655|nr:hypothetical protein [Brevibacterium epidermidis]
MNPAEPGWTWNDARLRATFDEASRIAANIFDDAANGPVTRVLPESALTEFATESAPRMAAARVKSWPPCASASPRTLSETAAPDSSRG